MVELLPWWNILSYYLTHTELCFTFSGLGVGAFRERPLEGR